jgi:hypothetical protein
MAEIETELKYVQCAHCAAIFDRLMVDLEDVCPACEAAVSWTPWDPATQPAGVVPVAGDCRERPDEMGASEMHVRTDGSMPASAT